MRIKKPISPIVFAMAFLALTGCGAGGGAGGIPTGGGGTTYDPNGSITLSNLSVAGTSTSVNGVAPISPGVNGGQFSVSFNSAGTALPNYSAYMYVSSASTIGGTATSLLIATNCGATVIGGNCATAVTTNCTFDNSNKVTCVNPLGGTFPAANLTNFLSSGIPKDAYLVVHACNAFQSVCSDVSAPIQLQ